MRFFRLLAVASLALATVLPARAMTQEEILQRRLEKMRQAEPQMQQEASQGQDQAGQAAAKVEVTPAKNDSQTLAVPAPVRQPTPEPRGGVWQKQQPPSASQPQATAKPAPAARPEASPQAAAPSQPQPAAKPAAQTPQPAQRDAQTAASLAALARKSASSGDLKTALTMLDEAVAADPADPDLRNNRANVLSNMGKPKEALADYDRAIAMKATDATFFANRGLAHERLGNQDRACADYKKACDLGDCDSFKSYSAEGHCR